MLRYDGTMSAQIFGLYELSLAARRQRLAEAGGGPDDARNELASGGLDRESAGSTIENVALSAMFLATTRGAV